MKKLSTTEKLLQIKKFINPLSGRSGGMEYVLETPLGTAFDENEAFLDLAPQDLANLPSMDELVSTNDATALVAPYEAPLYAEEVLAELEETMPYFSDEIDIETIPNFYTDDIEGDPMAIVASLKDKKEFTDRLKNIDLTRLHQSLYELMKIDGALTVAAVDWQSGLVLGSVGSELDVDVAARGNSEVVRTKRQLVMDLNLGEEIQDVLVTLETQYHLIRLTSSHIFIYLVLDRAEANLALALHTLTQVESEMQI